MIEVQRFERMDRSPPTARERLSPIIFVVYQSGSRANGGVQSISNIIDSLSIARPIVLTQRETPVNARWREKGIEVRLFDLAEPPTVDAPGKQWRRQGRRLIPFLKTNVDIARLIAETGARIVHCNDILSFWHAAPGARVAGASVLFNVRDLRESGRAYGIKWRAARALANQIVVLSQEMREEVERRIPVLPGFGRRVASDVRAIHSIVDPTRMHVAATDEREETRRQLGIATGEVAVVVVGSFCEKKNQLALIERALGKLANLCPNLVTSFVGDFLPQTDPYARRCQAAVERLGLKDRVRFVGYTSAVERWYVAADITCLASRNEGLARSMIESMACGTPVVSFDVSSAREMLSTRGAGCIVPQGNYALLVEVLARLAGNPVERAELGQRGAEIARHLFSPEQIRASYEDLYMSIARSQEATRQ